MAGTTLGRTQSLCPECFRRIDARTTACGEAVFLEKTCPDHGTFATRIWQGRSGYDHWVRPKIPIQERFDMTPRDKGCPFDCGLCPDHAQHTCTAVLEITRCCNLSCRFCFADASPGEHLPDPHPDTLKQLLEQVVEASPGCNLQLSGGEPTLRKDLPHIVALARQTGFSFVQLNTNGIRLGLEPGLATRLRAAGLDSVFLQFDGITDRVYETLRGRPLMEIKESAIRACAQNHIGVILVPTLVPGINTGEIGGILRYGMDRAPGVRGVHFQPVSYFGRHQGGASPPSDQDRITIPEVLAAIQDQSGGVFRAKDFKPSSCEHALCAFSGKFMLGPDKRPRALTLFNTGCCTPAPAEQGARKARASVVRHWKAPKADAAAPVAEDGLDRFLRQADQGMFTVSGMAFQDAWNLDLDRLKRLWFTGKDLEQTIHFFAACLEALMAPGDRGLIFLPGATPFSAGDLIKRAMASIGAVPRVNGLVTDARTAAGLIRETRPQVIIGMPVQMLALGELLDRSGEGVPGIGYAILTADHVSAPVAIRIERLFRCRALSHYGMTETGFGMAIQCPKREGLHIRHTDLVVEIVDTGTGRPLPPGNRGEIVVTTLGRMAMPLIRYRTGDVARLLDRPCACGSPFARLDRVRSRQAEGLDLGPGLVLTMADLDDALFALPGVVDFTAAIEKNNGDSVLTLGVEALVPVEVSAIKKCLGTIPAVKMTVDTGRLSLGNIEIRACAFKNTYLGKRLIRDNRSDCRKETPHEIL